MKKDFAVSGFESMILEKEIESFLLEDDLGRHPLYFTSLPKVSVSSKIKIKSDLILAGLPWFTATFKKLGVELEDLREFEGEKFKAGD